MNIEQSIKDVISTKLEEGIIEKLVAENLEKGINRCLDDLLGNYGDVTKVIKEKIKSVMIDQLSGYDYSKYIVKLDCVLTEILKNTTLDNKKILESFKELMINDDNLTKVKVSDIFEKYKKYVSENIDTSDLEVYNDDFPPRYEDVNVTLEVEYEEKRSWSSFRYAKIVFECEKDEKFNYEIHISKMDNFPWRIRLDDNIDSSINSLKHLDNFKIYLLKLYQNSSEINIDIEDEEHEIEIDREPEY